MRTRSTGPKTPIVSEMIKRLPMETIYTVTRFFHDRFMGQMESPSSWKVVKLVFLRKDQKLQSNSTDIGDVQVVLIMYLVASGEGKRARKVK